MLRFIGETSIDFMGLRRLGYAISGLLILIGLGFMGYRYSRSGSILNFGIDFAGGTIVQAKYSQEPPIDAIRDQLSSQGLRDARIQRFGDLDAQEILIRVGEQTEETHQIADTIRQALYSEEERSEIEAGRHDLNSLGRRELAAVLADAAGGGGPEAADLYADVAKAITDYRANPQHGVIGSYDELAGLEGLDPETRRLLEESTFLGDFAVIRVESVGPQVGADLKRKATGAVISAIIGILIYIWLRFEWRFGVAAVICLTHDVIVTVGAFALTNREVDLPVIAALLTIVGYSLNDTIVVFDRIRDNLKLMRREPVTSIINASINQTLSRTLLTSGTTLLVVVCLFVLGGGVINAFAFALLVGVLVGTYSSIFVASAFLLDVSRGSRPHIS